MSQMFLHVCMKYQIQIAHKLQVVVLSPSCQLLIKQDHPDHEKVVSYIAMAEAVRKEVSS